MSYDSQLFNVDPYYDDYNEDKKFLRMLFRPGYAVQARELTQLQTILQNQIERFGKNIFNEGSLVYGGEVIENRVRFARVMGITGTADVTDMIGADISSASASAKIIHAEIGLTTSSYDNIPVVFFEYTSGGTAFSAGDSIGGTAEGTTAAFSFTIGGVTGGSVTGQSIGDATLVSVAKGIRFIDGFFVSNDEQTIAAYSLTGATGQQVRLFETPTTRIGFRVSKEFVTETDDTTLRDPSYGFYNYAAPGADRFKIDLPLVQYGYGVSDNLDTLTTDNFSRQNFIEFIRIVNGDVIKREEYPDYAVLGDTLARRTYDESGNYTVEPFQININDQKYGATGATFSIDISAGKAYIFGYEFETIGSTRLDLPRATTTKIVEDANIQSVVGPYVLGSITGGSFPAAGLTAIDFASMPTVYFSSSKGASAFSHIGSGKVRGFQYVGAVAGDRNWRIDLFDIAMSAGSIFSQVKSMFVPSKTGSGEALFDIYSPTGGAVLEDFTNTLLFPTTAGNGVKTVTDIDYKVRFAKKISFSATGFASFSTSDLGLGSDPNRAFFDYGSGVVSPLPTFSIINESGDLVGATGNTGAVSNTLYITNGPSSTGGTVFGEVRLAYNSGGYVRRTKTLVEETLTVTGSVQYSVGPTGASNGDEYRLLNKKVDVFAIDAITGPSGQNFSNYFVLDTGNRDNYYDWSRLVFAPGFSSGTTAGLTGSLSVSIRRFGRTGLTAGPFTVDSYTSAINFSDIPLYTSPDTGKTYRLSDVVDFRPDKQEDGSFSPFCYPVSTAVELISVEKYLPRTDKLVLGRDKKFKVVTGLPSSDAAVPPDQPNAMTLYTISLPPYTYFPEDVSIRAIKNKRYTMEDIGNLEKRIDSVEFYTTMNLMEQEAKNTIILDTDGVEVPKKGILVDTFRGHNIGDVQDKMYNAAIDPETTTLRPAFSTKIYRMNLDTVASVNYGPSLTPLSLTGNRLFTMGYTGTPGVIQLQASSSKQLNPFGIINYTGTLFTNPESDFWMSDIQNPTVRVNPRGEKDNWAFSVRGGVGAEGSNTPGEIGGFGTEWNFWETMWFGKSKMDETNHQLFNKTTEDMSVSASSNSLNLSSSAIDRNLLPESIVVNNSSSKKNDDLEFYARNIEVLVRGDGLKPNTKLYAFLDDSTTPLSISTLVMGLTALAGPTGTTGWVYTDSKGSFGGMSAGQTGYAIRINQTGNTKVGTRLIRFCDSSTNNISAITTVAEKNFSIEGSYGVKETDIVSTRRPTTKRATPNSSTIVNNIFTKETSTTAVSKGYVEPLSQSFSVDPVLYPYGVFIKDIDLWFKTKDTNNVPVILELKPMLSGYPHPSKVMPNGTITILSSDINVSDDATSKTKFAFNSPIYLSPGVEYCFSLRTSSKNFSLHTAILNQTIYQITESDPELTVTKQPFVRALFTAQSQNSLMKDAREDLKFVVNFCKFNTGSPTSVIQLNNIGTDYFGTESNPCLVRFEIPVMSPPGTTVLAEENGLIGQGSFTRVLLNKNITRSKETSLAIPTGPGLTGTFSTARLTLSSTNEYVSPIVDLDRAAVLLVDNQINNNRVGLSNDNGEESPNNRNKDSSVRSESRYITKKINLENAATRLDVYLRISNPPNTGAEVFARTLPDETDSNTFFHNRGYQKMTASTERNTADGEYQDIKYTLSLTDDQRFSTFAIKVVLYGDNDVPNHPIPTIRSMKVIAT